MTRSCWQVVVGCLAWQMAAGTQWCLVFRALSLWLLFEHTTFKSDCERRCRPVYFQLFAASAKAPRVSSHMIVKHPFKNSVIQQTSSSLIKFNIINITFSTTYFLHPRLPHSATISRDDHTLSCFRNTVDTLRTLTSWLEYYTKTFIDAIMKLSTLTMNHGLTVISPLLLLVLTILHSAKHGQ